MCGVRDVVDTFKKMVMHWPAFKNHELQKCHSFFLTPLERFNVAAI